MLDGVDTIVASGARLAAPLAFAACGEYLAERAGTMNISVEAMMLGAAFGSVAAASATGSVLVGLAAGVGVGVAVGAAHGNLAHRARVNTFVVGLVLNALVLGVTSYLATLWVFPMLSGQRWPGYLLLLLAPLTWWLVERSRWGLELRAAGANPDAARATGVRVDALRRQALLWCGALAGLGGAYLAVGEVGSFNQNMTAGRGYLVVAAVLFGAGRLRRTLLACALFALADALRLSLPALGVTLNPHLLIATPYLLALAAMLLFPPPPFSRRSRA